MLLADLAVMDNVDEFAAKIGALTDRIDLLVNNAGATPTQRIETADGLEQTFAANHLAVFLLTHRLLPLLYDLIVRHYDKGLARINLRYINSEVDHHPNRDAWKLKDQ